ncbi:hypothetical protein WJX72_003057 [[Myrmecia] bisecta]|uniref:DNA-directed RNA polymerase n=1 Tax=[Myrmecia] bisecta TaxID=41462 RepID=A0AAW1PZR5_9CHLO
MALASSGKKALSASILRLWGSRTLEGPNRFADLLKRSSRPFAAPAHACPSYTSDEAEEDMLRKKAEAQEKLLALVERFRQHGESITRRRQQAGKPNSTVAMRYVPLKELLDAQIGGSSAEDAVLDRWQRQVEKEVATVQKTADQYAKELEVMQGAGFMKRATLMKPVQLLMTQWYHRLEKAIEQEQKDILNGVRTLDAAAYGPFLLLLKPEIYAVMTMHCVVAAMMSESEGGQVKLSKVSSSLGKAVQSQVGLEALKRNLREDNKRRRAATRQRFAAGLPVDTICELEQEPSELPSWLQPEPSFERRMRLVQTRYAQPKSFKGNQGVDARDMGVLKKVAQMAVDDPTMWTIPQLAKVGCKLVELLIQTAKVRVTDWDVKGEYLREEPAFEHRIDTSYNKGSWKKHGMIACHPKVMDKLVPRPNSDDHHRRAEHMSRWLPMLVPPLPWKSPTDGGHLVTRNTIMRLRTDHVQSDCLEEANNLPVSGLNRIYDALNALGSVGWSINTSVLPVVEEAWRRGGGIADLPSAADVPLPERNTTQLGIHVQNGQLQAYNIANHPATQRAWYIQKLRAQKKNRELHSLRCDLQYKLEVAKEFKDEEVFYYPHNLDFRGRAYPMHPHLNHLGSDVCRGLLQFAEARPLGNDGLDWLKIQVANLYGSGADKLALGERKTFVDRHLAKVIDSAERPFDGSRWWLEADSPWQLLATCMDIREALASGNHRTYVSRLPVHQDGSCNGLQHYAALGRDLSGGQAVNLMQADKPQDVYSKIAALVHEKVQTDAATGHADAVRLAPFVNRKLIKQTVMTSVYGVTFVGAREQIGNQLRSRGWMDEKAIFKTSNYAAKVTLLSLHDMFTNAKAIMDWLSNCAKNIARDGEAVGWTTPLGLPVVQPYRKPKTKSVQTVLQRLILSTTMDDGPVQVGRQRTAFPPNYIHSVDSAHMMMTATECRKAGLDFAGVHDSFWTHACDVPIMNRILREQFIKLHEQPLLEQLKDEFHERYPAVFIPPIPPKGELDLQEVLKSDYFFN